MNNKDTDTESRTLIRMLEAIRRAASLCSRAYLREAKYGSDPQITQSLEAIAIKRALVADTVEELARDRFGEGEPGHQAPLSQQADVSIDAADKQLIKACDRLYRSTEDKALKGFSREVRKSVSGLVFNAYSEDPRVGNPVEV